MKDVNEKNKQKETESLINEVIEDFKARQRERKSHEAQWQLNNNFLTGNQYCGLNSQNDVEDYEKQYFWQEREVFNHIAPLIEARLSKLAQVRPILNIMPASNEEHDIKIARLSRDIINNAYEKLNLDAKITEATKWSEVCGSVFYKIVWNSSAGRNIAKNRDNQLIYEGEVEVIVVPPYELFPDSSCSPTVEDCASIIHAKAYNVNAIKNIWGVDVKGSNVDVFSLEKAHTLGGLGYSGSATRVGAGTKSNHAIVIEKYEVPTIKYPEGRLVIVCEDKLLYVGTLPYINSVEQKRGYPFIRQCSGEQIGCFWGVSVIERTIPVQRAYNAVKNRKHEFLNRISMGVLTVEDGSVDTDNLEIEGLSPGKVLIYRQGSTPPQIMSSVSVPADFTAEENRLLNEFAEISGVSSFMRNSGLVSTNISGVTLQLLIEQDEARLVNTTSNIKAAVKELGRQILSLYKQYASTPRLLKISNSKGEIELAYWNKSDINCNDIIVESTPNGSSSLAGRQSMILELLNSGLLHSEDGKISAEVRQQILEVLGLAHLFIK